MYNYVALFRTLYTTAVHVHINSNFQDISNDI